MAKERPCSVADDDCTAPANYENTYTKGTCYACGQPVCMKCSKTREWYHYGRNRICRNCDLAEARFQMLR